MDEMDRKELHSGMTPDNLARLARMCLMDDRFMSEVLDGKTDAVQVILDTVLERSDLKVIAVKSQYQYNSAVSREIRLDIRAEDASGRLADIEIQRADDAALLLRARYYAAVMDSRLLQKGADFGALGERFVIFITETDPLGKGVPLYHIHNTIDELNGADAADGGLTVLVNGAFRDAEHPVGRLMHDFFCTEADDMLIPVLAREVRYMKETERGQAYMCDILEEMVQEKVYEIMDIMIEEGILSDAAIAKYTRTTPEQVAARRSGQSA